MAEHEPAPARRAPECEDCGADLARMQRYPGWWCFNCDGSEEEVIAGIEEAERRERDEEGARVASGCTCDEFGDYQCDVHGAEVIAEQRAQHEQALREEGRGRRGPYWRPREARVGLRPWRHVPGDGSTRRERHGVRRYALARAVGADPLALRSHALLRAYFDAVDVGVPRPRCHVEVDHAAVLAHLREPGPCSVRRRAPSRAEDLGTTPPPPPPRRGTAVVEGAAAGAAAEDLDDELPRDEGDDDGDDAPSASIAEVVEEFAEAIADAWDSGGASDATSRDDGGSTDPGGTSGSDE